MKGLLFTAVILALAVSVSSLPGNIRAQEEEEVETEYAYGTVKSITSSQIVVKEYDYENDTEVDVIYTIGPDVEYEGVSSYKDISAGDSVEIDYVVKGGKKIATLISAEEPFEEEEGLIIDE